jgi:hypothetical protein
LEKKTGYAKKQAELEEVYKNVPKIAFHELSDEGNRLFLQARRDKLMTTIGWSMCGNIFGIGVATYVEKSRA